jgi:hypothetical protein
MKRLIVGGVFFSLLGTLASGFIISPAVASCPVPNTLTNGTTADAIAVMQNFSSIGGCAAPSASPSFTGTVNSTGPFMGADLATFTRNRQSISLAPSTGTDASYINMANVGGRGLLGVEGNLSSGPILLNGDIAYATALGTVTPTPLQFGTNGLVNMTIASGGAVGIAITVPSYTLHVNGSVAGSGPYNNLSDARLKKNIVPLVGGMALLSQLEPVRFDWRAKEERAVGKDLNLSEGHQVGFLAQNVRKVLPEAVSVASGRDAIMSVAESKIVPVLVSAVQELKAANDTQASEIARLESQLLDLQRKVGDQTAQR